MTDTPRGHEGLGALFRATIGSSRTISGDADYRLLSKVGAGFAAMSRDARPSLVIPLTSAVNGIARTAAGCSLIPAEAVTFEFNAERWTQPAAVLECTELRLLDVFAVFAADVAARLATGPGVEWSQVAELVDAWQGLLAFRRTLSPEGEMGLWAEVWFILQSDAPDDLVRGWRGPDRDRLDFIVDGIGVDVKASATKLAHFLSQNQTDEPLGEYPSYFLSIWLAIDPMKGRTLPVLADELLHRCEEPALALKNLARAGFVFSERESYTRAFLVLEEPSWFDAASVPHVRSIDRGVSQLRYLAQLIDVPELDSAAAAAVREKLRLSTRARGTDAPR
jgi:hypothetical protein